MTETCSICKQEWEADINNEYGEARYGEIVRQWYKELPERMDVEDSAEVYLKVFWHYGLKTKKKKYCWECVYNYLKKYIDENLSSIEVK